MFGSCGTDTSRGAPGMQVSAIVAVGLTEGVDHVNWKKFFKIVAWWYLGCIPVFAVTAIAYWQGDAPLLDAS